MPLQNPHSDPVEPIPIPPHRQKITNLFTDYSVKAEQFLQFESDWEYRFFILCECNPEVKQLCSKPLNINTRIKQKKVNKTFDMWCCWDDGYREYIDVKPNRQCIEYKSGALLPAEWDLIEEWANQFNPIVNIRHISDAYINANAKFIINWLDLYPVIKSNKGYEFNQIKQKIQIYLNDYEKLKIGELFKKLSHDNSEEIIYAVINMLYRGDCYADLNKYEFDLNLVLSNG